VEILSKDSERAPLSFGQARDLDDRDLLETEQLCRGITAVAGDHEASLVDQDRNQKSECLDAVSDLADLLLRMCPCVTRVRLERVDRNTFHHDHEPLL